MAIDYSEHSGLLFPKGEPRVLTRIDDKLKLEKQERDCRKAVKARDKGRCRVPTCRERSAHLHHVVYRSQGGKWQSCNIVSLCVRHHQFVHAGLLHLSGDADGVLAIEGRIA